VVHSHQEEPRHANVGRIRQARAPALRSTYLQQCAWGVDYQSKFLALVTRCTDLVKKHQIDIFTNGLHNPLKTDVELEAPTTLEDAMALARTYEQRLNMGKEPAPRPQQCSFGRTGTAAKPLALPALATAMTSSTPRMKRLT
jgi:hypothetical protein